MASATSWGIESELLTPAEVVKLVPYVAEDVILGGSTTPGVGVVDSLRAGTLMRERATSWGAHRLPATEVQGIDVDVGRIARVRTSKGDVPTPWWSVAGLEPSDRADGRRLDPADAGSAPDDQRRPRAAVRRHRRRDRVRDRPGHGYEHVRAPARRRPGGRLLRASADPDGRRRHPLHRGVGALADRAALHPGRLRPADGRRWSSSPTSGTSAGGSPRDQRATVAHARRHAHPGRDARGAGLWSAAAIWIKEAPGIARAVAEWMTDGTPEIDPHASDIAGSGRISARPSTCARARPRASTRPTASCTPPSSGPRTGTALALFHARQRELDGVFVEAAGWERPQWYARTRGSWPDTATGTAARRGMGIEVVVSHHQCRAPRDARPGGHRRPHGVHDPRRRRARRGRIPAGAGRRAGRRAGRPGRVHAAAERGRRDRGRPHDHARGTRRLPGGDRRGLGSDRSEAVRRPPARRRIGARVRRDVRLVHARRVGTEGSRPRRVRHGRRCLERRIPLRDVPGDRHRIGAGARLPDLLRGRPGVELYAPMETEPGCGTRCGRRAATSDVCRSGPVPT